MLRLDTATRRHCVWRWDRSWAGKVPWLDCEEVWPGVFAAWKQITSKWPGRIPLEGEVQGLEFHLRCRCSLQEKSKDGPEDTDKTMTGMTGTGMSPSGGNGGEVRWWVGMEVRWWVGQRRLEVKWLVVQWLVIWQRRRPLEGRPLVTWQVGLDGGLMTHLQARTFILMPCWQSWLGRLGLRWRSPQPSRRWSSQKGLWKEPSKTPKLAKSNRNCTRIFFKMPLI